MKLLASVSLFFVFLYASPAFADVSEQEAMEAQVSGALASADYATQKCPNLRVDSERLNDLSTRMGKSLDDLRKMEEYKEQEDVLLAMEKTENASMICLLLPLAHGGYAGDILDER